MSDFTLYQMEFGLQLEPIYQESPVHTGSYM